jgi:hypothetical protein
MLYRRLLKTLGLMVILFAASRSSSAVPEYVYCCAYDCALVPIAQCSDGGWTSADACNLHCNA